MAFESEIKKSLEMIDNLYYYKFPDTHAIRGLSLMPTHFFPKVPADFLVIIKGKIFFLECKSSHNKTSYNFDFITDEQLAIAEQFRNLKVEYYFLINNRSTKNKHYCIVLTPIRVRIYKRDLKVKSCKWKYLDFELHRKDKGTLYKEMLEELITRILKEEERI